MNQASGRFRPIDPETPIEKRQRKLPHWTQPGATYFVTFRLWDSLPRGLVEALNVEKRVWLEHHPKPWPKIERRYYYRRFHEQVERWLDAGYGSRCLEDPELAGIVVEAFRHFDGERYTLDRFTVMPNHTHNLVMPQTHTLEQILMSWKSYTANELNRRLRRRGRFWMDESYDHLVRSVPSLEYYREYIRRNPVKAKLAEGHYAVGTGTGIKVD